MIVVVASGHDPRARSVVAHWGSQCATMLTAEDFCVPGWQFAVPRPQDGMAVIGGRLVADAEIEGILTLRPCIYPEELLSIAAAHRRYVAAELNAFLLAWLAARTCPVLNRPTASCLAGPNWRAEQWTLAAARLGIPVQTRHCIPGRHADRTCENVEDAYEITVVGEQCFGCQDASLRTSTLRLARAAGVDLVSVRFSRDEGRFLSANVWPSLTDAAVIVAVHEALANRSETRR
jgi:hypothetical protein